MQYERLNFILWSNLTAELFQKESASATFGFVCSPVYPLVSPVTGHKGLHTENAYTNSDTPSYFFYYLFTFGV